MIVVPLSVDLQLRVASALEEGETERATARRFGISVASAVRIGHTLALAPLGDRLLVDPVALRQRPQALLTMLYRSTDCLRRGGAPVKNLSHSASLHAGKNNAPSNSGIKHLVKMILG